MLICLNEIWLIVSMFNEFRRYLKSKARKTKSQKLIF